MHKRSHLSLVRMKGHGTLWVYIEHSDFVCESMRKAKENNVRNEEQTHGIRELVAVCFGEEIKLISSLFAMK